MCSQKGYNIKGGGGMTNTELLEKVIANSGYKKQFLASKIGLSYQGFLNKVQNKQDFRAKEIMILCKLLRISSELKEAIFLPRM